MHLGHEELVDVAVDDELGEVLGAQQAVVIGHGLRPHDDVLELLRVLSSREGPRVEVVVVHMGGLAMENTQNIQ